MDSARSTRFARAVTALLAVALLAGCAADTESDDRSPAGPSALATATASDAADVCPSREPAPSALAPVLRKGEPNRAAYCTYPSGDVDGTDYDPGHRPLAAGMTFALLARAERARSKPVTCRASEHSHVGIAMRYVDGSSAYVALSDGDCASILQSKRDEDDVPAALAPIAVAAPDRTWLDTTADQLN